jgi:hypothetical protein
VCKSLRHQCCIEPSTLAYYNTNCLKRDSRVSTTCKRVGAHSLWPLSSTLKFGWPSYTARKFCFFMFWVLQVATLHVSRFPSMLLRRHCNKVRYDIPELYLCSMHYHISIFVMEWGLKWIVMGLGLGWRHAWKYPEIRNYLVMWTRMPRLKLSSLFYNSHKHTSKTSLKLYVLNLHYHA